MFQLVESLRIESCELHNVELHNRRLNKAIAEIWGKKREIDLVKIIDIPPDISGERYKCRVVFTPENISYSISPYTQRIIRSLRIVTDNSIDYTYKTSNRDKLNAAFEKRDTCDDIIIVKNGFIADSSASNILLFDGSDWITPDTPLLKGTQREYLLLNKKIIEQPVPVSALNQYHKIKLINAMIDFERAPEINIPDGIF